MTPGDVKAIFLDNWSGETLWWLHPEQEAPVDVLIRFIASLDDHRGIDIGACFEEWLKTQP